MQQSVFVIMPFSEEFDDIYEHLIDTPFSEAGYNVMRADDILNQQNILADIIQSIKDSDFIVADLSKANPNVYYELGLAHAREKNVIMIVEENTKIPFDLSTYRAIQYGTNFVQMKEAEKNIKKLIKEMQAGKAKFGNPVTDFGGSELIPAANSTQSSGTETETKTDCEDEYGFIDYQIEFDENMAIINNIVTEVGERIRNLTVKMESTTDQITNPNRSDPRIRRRILRSMAADINDYATWLKESNNQYREALGKVGQSVNGMISGEFIDESQDKEKLSDFVNIIWDTEMQIQEAQSTFSHMAEITDALPRIEKDFNRSARFMSSESRNFVDNIKETNSVLTRARNVVMKIIGDDHMNWWDKIDPERRQICAQIKSHAAQAYGEHFSYGENITDDLLEAARAAAYGVATEKGASGHEAEVIVDAIYETRMRNLNN